MQRRFDKLRSMLALTLSAAMIFTAVPEVALTASAAEAYDEAVVEAMLEAMVSEGDVEDIEIVEEVVEETVEESAEETVEETVVAEPETDENKTEENVTEETTEENATEETAVEETVVAEPVTEETVAETTEAEEIAVEEIVEASDAEILEYQTSKLKITKKTTTIYTGQTDVLVAEVGYAKTTSGNGIGYTYSFEGGYGAYAFSVDNSDPYKVLVSLYSTIPEGTYYLILTPEVPANVKAESVKIAINVKASVDKVILDVPDTIYKQDGKAASFQSKVLLRHTTGKSVKAPVTYSVQAYADGFPVSGNAVTVSKSGKVTIAKNAQVSDITVYASACDYPGHIVSDSEVVTVSSKAMEMGDLSLFKNGYYWPANSADADLMNRAYLTVHAPGSESGWLDRDLFTYKSSNAKSVAIDENGFITVVNPSNKAVTLTATAKDGSKVSKSIKVIPAKKTVSANEIIAEIVNFSMERKTTDEADENNVIAFDNATESVLMIRISSSYSDFVDASITNVKGAKNITSKYLSFLKKMPMSEELGYLGNVMVISPTAKDVSFTIKAGNTSETYILRNVSKVEKQKVENGEPKITTSATIYNMNEQQKIKFFVGKNYAGKNVEFIEDFNYMTASMSSYFVYMAMMNVVSSSDMEIDEAGYATLTISNLKSMQESMISSFKAEGMNGKFPGSLKMKYVIKDGSDILITPTTITFKFTKTPTTSDYKLKTSYTLERQLGATSVYSMESGDDSHLFAELTYTGSKVPATKVVFKELKGDLAADLLGANDLTQLVELCKDKDVADKTYIGLSDDTVMALNEAGKGGATISGKLYLTYQMTTPAGVVITKTDTIKVSFKVPVIEK